jgi:hypothetical protein
MAIVQVGGIGGLGITHAAAPGPRGGRGKILTALRNSAPLQQW